MTLTELKTQLTNVGYELIGSEKETGSLNGYTYYDIKTLFTEGTSIFEKTISSAVDSNGNAFYSGENPVFIKELRNYLQTKKSEGTIDGSHINWMNSFEEVAEVSALWTNAQGEQKKARFNVFRNASGNIDHKMIT